jgi:peptidoglycan hydrolase-like protein with peptidoglycan-binding domain
MGVIKADKVASARTYICSLSSPSSTKYTFTRNLYLGIEGEDVKQLQVFLNSKGFLIATSGRGSKGNEITYFGPGTKSALAKYQASQSLPATGYFGPLSRGRIK